MKAKLILILAVVMGLFTTFLFYQYMQKLDTSNIAAPSELVQIVVTSKDIAENERITAEMLTTAPYPKQAVTTEYTTDVSEVAGKVAEANMAMGEPVLSHRLVDEQKESLIVARKVKEGFRAVSVGVNFVQTVSNLIEPEDIVDVVVTKPNPQTGELDSKLLLEGIRVIAVGRRMIELTSQEAYAEYSAVTLEVRPQDALKVVNADEQGNIQLVLHSRVKEVESEEGNNDG